MNLTKAFSPTYIVVLIIKLNYHPFASTRTFAYNDKFEYIKIMKEKKIWWIEYRKRIYRPNVRNMSFETVFRMNFKTTLKEYIHNCSLAGVKRMCEANQSIEQRIIRIILFCVMLGMIVYFFQNLWFENLARPLIVTMESATYPISNIEFPAVTLCNFNRISKKAVEEYVKLHYREIAQNNETKKEVEWFCTQLGKLVDNSYNKSLQVQSLIYSFAAHLGDSHNLIKLMQQLSPPCEQMLVRCSWAGDIVDCDTIFSVQRTYHGHCCAFNLVVGDQKSDRTDRTIYRIKRQHDSGLLQGLNVILDPMVDDYTYSTFNMYGFEVLIFDATHYADPTGGRVVQRSAQPNQAVQFEVLAIKQVATTEVRKYPPKTRKCLFRDEIEDEFYNLYSYSACIVRCRIKALKSLCKCTPYYFPTLNKDDNICTIDHLKCLNRYKEKLKYLYPKDAINTDGLEVEIQDAVYCSECLPDCELTQYNIKHSKIPLIYVANENKEFASFFFKGLNMSSKCLLSIYQATSDGILNRLDIVFYWFEIVSNVGGFCGILVGFSLISILEFIYFFVFRFFWNLYHLYYNND